MKLHKLIIQAFGPYTDRVELDFDKGLQGSTMFLIHGKTGAGKTTILDALAFALYGEASGSARSGTMLRSDFVDKTVKTEVELTFSLGSAYYRIHRTPTYTVEGNKTARQATAALYETVDGAERLVASKTGAVTDRIVALTGFRSDEFRQVVLLPQGEFRTFLLANSNERSKLMTTLFDTGKYGVLERKLKERADVVRQANEENRREQERILADAGVPDAATLQSMATEEKAGLAAKQQAVEAAEKQHAVAQKALADGTALATWFDKLAQAEAAQKTDAETQPKVEAYRQRLAQAQKGAMLIDKAERAADAKLQAEASARKTQASQTECANAEQAAKKAEMAWNAAEADAPKRETAKLRVQKLAEAQESVRALGTLKRRIASAKNAALREADACKEAGEAVRKAKQAVDRLHVLERAGKALSLAQMLKDGEKCPVCGSTNHPEPAKPSQADEIVPTEKEIQDAEQALSSAEAMQTKRQAALSKKEADVASLEGQWATEHKQLPDGVTEDVKAVERLYQTAVQEAETMETAYATAQKAHQKAQAALSAARATLESSKRFAEEQRTEAEKTAKAFQDALVAAGFADAAAYEAAIAGAWKQESHRKKVEQHIRDFEDAKLQHETQLQQAALQTKGKERPDMDALMEEAQRAGAAWKQAVGAAKSAEFRLVQETKQLDRLAKLQKEEAALAAKARVVGHLAQVACAEHPYRVHFQTYIQRSIFRDVMAAANERLRIMSSGRYALEIGKEANGHAFEGLAIAVFDDFTGKTRETSSLSGGESFLASLALALGLADTVTRYSEGIRLDTMFIDEGFGSLDEETLDTALKALMKLQEGGRVIGIISHVRELAACIGDRIEVVKTPKGSTAHFAHGTLAE